MEYERIHKVQAGLLSPSKLRMKLVGVHHQRKTKDGSTSNCNSSRTSPSKVDDSEFVKNSLLAASYFDEEAFKLPGDTLFPNGSQSFVQTKEISQLTSPLPKGEGGNSSSIHPLKVYEDENLDYDSTSSFEFHKGERSMQHSMARSFSRPMPSKWNDAEKWIMNRQNIQTNHHPPKKIHFHNHTNRMPGMSIVRVAPESPSFIENKLAVKRVDFCQPSSDHSSHPISGQGNAPTASFDLCPEGNNLAEMDDGSLAEDKGFAGIRSVSMRDMGTEMTPIPSQEPSRTATPTGATTPLRSPTSSIPSTPRRSGEESKTVVDLHAIDQRHDDSQGENCNRELSEQELKLKTRKEIVSLGLKLGKTNIAAWASNKDEKERNGSVPSHGTEMTELEHQIEFTKRATAWEEAEKTKHAARSHQFFLGKFLIYKREEIKIQAWESQQEAKLEAEIRRIEAQVERMRAQGQAKMVKKIAMAKKISEEKRAKAEARKNQQAEKTAADAEYIRQTGRFPSASLSCCGW
ncbi:hypothetical protein DM860_002075 [Cuscuta australis]|uniref:Remorin C-terminal domain-containing protein n=1 Tax=Cuscuta australis TaxID=267555 RepID=A0A328DVQ5_9ASTE|nr:hypothetical protein DM860_002075 [Cuscuta australis]